MVRGSRRGQMCVSTESHNMHGDGRHVVGRHGEMQKQFESFARTYQLYRFNKITVILSHTKSASTTFRASRIGRKSTTKNRNTTNVFLGETPHDVSSTNSQSRVLMCVLDALAHWQQHIAPK